jgi:hypothetical protein
MSTNQSIPTNTASATLAWMLTFSAGITAAPATYGFTAPDAVALDALVTTFDAAWTAAGVTNRLANDDTQYTKPLRAAMYSARNAALGMCRQMAVLIQANDGILDMDKLAIGVQPRNFSRTPILVPATAPIIAVQFATPGVHTIAFADTITPASKRKPFGAMQLQLWAAAGVATLPTPAGMSYFGAFTKNPVLASWDPAETGKIASYAARWIGRRGDVGPFGAVAAMTIAF